MFHLPLQVLIHEEELGEPEQPIPIPDLNLVELENPRRRRLFRDRLDPLQVPDNHLRRQQTINLNKWSLYLSFCRYYRLPRHLIIELCDLLTPYLQHPTQRSYALPVILQVLIGLRFLASGGFQSLLGDIVHVSQSTCSRTLAKFCGALQELSHRYITYDIMNPNFVRDMKEGFHNIANMPNVIGAVDCTHVLLIPPVDDKQNYINRKGQSSLNVQVVCDVHLKILNIVVRWPGASHDSFIWENCALKRLLDQHICPQSYLLGDSGYPLEQYMLTPLRNPATPAEERFNMAHIRTRNTIERCFGVLKGRFRALHASGGVLMYTPEKVQKIIIAGAVLHNMCIEAGVELEEQDVLPPEDEPEVPIPMLRQNIGGEIIRREIVQRFQI